MYEEAMLGSEKKEGKMAQKEVLNPIVWTNNWIHTVLPPGKHAFSCKVVLKRDRDQNGSLAC